MCNTVQKHCRNQNQPFRTVLDTCLGRDFVFLFSCFGPGVVSSIVCIMNIVNISTLSKALLGYVEVAKTNLLCIRDDASCVRVNSSVCVFLLCFIHSKKKGRKLCQPHSPSCYAHKVHNFCWPPLNGTSA